MGEPHLMGDSSNHNRPPKEGELIQQIHRLRLHGRTQDALSLLDRALIGQPKRNDLRCLQAEIQIDLGRYEQAILTLEMVRARNPREPRVDELLRRLSSQKRKSSDPSTAMQDVLPDDVFEEEEEEDTVVIDKEVRKRLQVLEDKTDTDGDPVYYDPPTREIQPSEVEWLRSAAEMSAAPTLERVRSAELSAAPTVESSLRHIDDPPTVPSASVGAQALERIRSKRPSIMRAPSIKAPEETPATPMSHSALKDHGSFAKLSTNILKDAEKISLKGSAPKVESRPGLDSYLAKVIGTTPQKPIDVEELSDASFVIISSDNLSAAPTEELASAAPGPPPLKGLSQHPTAIISNLQEEPAPPAFAANPRANSATKPLPPEPAPSPLPSTSDINTAPIKIKPPPAAPQQVDDAPGVVVDRGYGEDDPTTNMDQEEAAAEIERARAYASRAREQKQQTRAHPLDLANPPELPPPGYRIDFRKLITRSLIFGAVFFFLYLLFWFPFAWQRHLDTKMMAGIEEGRALLLEGTYADVEQARLRFHEVRSLQGSRVEAMDKILGWYVETIWRDDSLQELREISKQEEAFAAAFGAKHHDGGLSEVSEALLDALDTHSLNTALAQAYVALEQERDTASLHDWESLTLPSARASIYFAERALDANQPEKARRYAIQAGVLAPQSLLPRVLLAQSYERDEPGEALRRYDALSKTYGQDHPLIALRRAGVVLSLGGFPKEELTRLVSARPALLSPKGKAKAHFYLGEIAIRSGHPDEVEASLRAALALDASNAAYAALLIGHYLEQGRTEDAETLLRESLEQRPESPMLKLRMAELLLYVGEMGQAFSLLNELAEDHVPSMYRLGVMALEHQEVALAHTLFEQAASQSRPGPAQELLKNLSELLSDTERQRHDAWFRLDAALPNLRRDEKLTVAWALVTTRAHLDVAQEVFEEVLSGDPTHPSSLAGLCAIVAPHGAEAKTLKRCGEGVALAQRYSPALYWAGRAYLRLERFSDAFDALQKVGAIYPSESVLRSAILSAIMIWKLDEAEEFLDLWLTHHGSSPEHYYFDGLVALRSGNIEGSRELLGHAIKEEGIPPIWRATYAEALYETGAFRKAKDALRGLNDVPGARSHAEFVLSCIALNERSPNAAADHASRALKAAQEDRESPRMKSRALVALARAEIDLNRPQEASKHLQQAIDIDHRNIEAHYQMGLLELRYNAPTRAKASFERALDHYPKHKPSRRALEKLQ